MEDIGNTDGTRNDIFNIQLNSEGNYWLLRFCRLVKWILLVGIIASIPVFVTNVYELSRDRSQTLAIFRSRPLLRLQFSIYPYFWLTYIVLWFAQTFFYWKFSRVVNRAVLNTDEQGFNESFRYLYNNARITVIIILISIGNNILNMLVTMKYR